LALRLAGIVASATRNVLKGRKTLVMRFFHVKSRSRFVAHVQNVSHGLPHGRSTEDLCVNGSLGG
jgi:hypothetical protein